MRGTLRHARLAIKSGGIIPAYAGNTEVVSFHSMPIGDHPRVCGEHVVSVSGRVTDSGSSPRMRGTRVILFLPSHDIRIIPAYAGNTSAARRREYMRWDHPRVCGEHITPNPFANAVLGSSPRMRGTRNASRSGTISCGIIPAYAGNTRTNNRHPCGAWDHPRVCGEHELQPLNTSQQSGSSPRMRGTHARIRSP